MKAELKNIMVVNDFTILPEKYMPSDKNNFYVTLSLNIGPDNDDSSEIFDVFIKNNYNDDEIYFTYNDIVFSKGTIYLEEYDYQKVINAIKAYINTCIGNSWIEIAEKLEKVFDWEFENYQD